MLGAAVVTRPTISQEAFNQYAAIRDGLGQNTDRMRTFRIADRFEFTALTDWLVANWSDYRLLKAGAVDVVDDSTWF